MTLRIGTIVQYQRFGTPGGEFKAGGPSPAIVTEVFENNDAQVFVINPNGLYFNRVPFSEQPKPGHWSFLAESKDK